MKKYLLCGLLGLQFCAFGASLHDAPRENNKKPLQGFCLAFVPEGKAIAGNHYRFPLHVAVLLNDLSEVKRLIALGVDINDKLGDGATPLFMACHLGLDKIAEILINAGANVNTVNFVGKAPLATAVVHGYSAIVEMLLRAGARHDVMSKVYMTPLRYSVSTLFPDGRENERAAILSLLMSYGADIHTWRGETVLHTVARHHWDESVKKIIETGHININELDELGETALDKAIASNDHKTTELLCKAGAMTGSYVKFNNLMRAAAQVTSIVIPSVMIGAQLLMGYWIHHRINTDPIFRRATALSLLHERYDPYWLFEPRNLVLEYLGKNIN